MVQQPRTRQELYDLIRKTSREEFVLAEMKRLGFWGNKDGQPSLPEVIVDRRNQLTKELRELYQKERKISNPEQVLKEYRQKRLRESREKQAANRERKEQERLDKAKKWKERKVSEILYLGEGISAGLNNKECDAAKLAKFGLAPLEDTMALAKALGIGVSTLQFLAYHRKVSRTSHYQRFYMAKKTGGKRLISAPMPILKMVQYRVLENILDRIPVHDQAHGFAKERSIVSNAKPHVGQDLVVNLDFKGFFPTLDFKRVKGAFRNLGYSEHVAIILAALCTEPDQDKVKMDGIEYFVNKGERHLPQGAPTSPMLTNIICYKLDKRLAGLAEKNGFRYSRYADDLTFSASGKSVENLTQLLWAVRKITKDEGFVLHPEKLRIMRKGSRQEVTGIVVNEQMGVSRKNLRKFRALLHQIKTTGWENKRWGHTPNTKAAVWGYANFVYMVTPEKGVKLLEEVKALIGTIPKKKSAPITNRVMEEMKKVEKKVGKKDKKSDKPKWKMW